MMAKTAGSQLVLGLGMVSIRRTLEKTPSKRFAHFMLDMGRPVSGTSICGIKNADNGWRLIA
jgi:hypothetical protein